MCSIDILHTSNLFLKLISNYPPPRAIFFAHLFFAQSIFSTDFIIIRQQNSFHKTTMPLCSSPLQHIPIFKHSCNGRRSKDKRVHKMTGVQLNELIDNPLHELVIGSCCYNVCHTLHKKINRLSMSPPSAKRLKTTTPPSQPA